MSSRRSTVVALALVLGLAGCKKPEKKEQSEAPKEVSSALAAAGAGDLEAFFKDETAPLTSEMEEKLLLGLESCAVGEFGIDDKCEGMKRWNKSRGRKTAFKQVVGASNALGTKYIGHQSPAIRYKAADLMGSMFGVEATTERTILDAAAKEKVPAVLANMMQVVGSKVKTSEEVKALLMKGAEHDSERVRMEALGWFLTSFSAGVPGTFEKAADKLDKDPSMKVRQHVCSRLYGSKNDKALPLFDKYLSDKSTPGELFASCFDGVIAGWSGVAKPDAPNQKAYDLTMKVLEAPARSKERPPAWGISTLRWAKTEYKADDPFGPKWYEKVKGWYKKERLLKALEAIAMDANANWTARSSSLETMKELGSPKAALERVHKKVEKADKGDDWLVRKKAEDLLKAM